MYRLFPKGPGTLAARLAGVPALKKVVQRCRQDNGGADAQIRWFIHPVSFVAAVRAACDAGRTAGARVGDVVAVHVIARPHANVDAVIPLGRQTAEA